MEDGQNSKGDARRMLNFGDRVVYTEEFLQVWQHLSRQKQRIVRKKIALLVADPRHPSLKVHRLKRANSEVWECYLIDSFPQRLLFQRQGDKILLVRMGGHHVVDRCHTTKFGGKSRRS
jgi:mRNA-degrading endonuclease YafQ of YafQ-DinJ toxin-antitoxin module